MKKLLVVLLAVLAVVCATAAPGMAAQPKQGIYNQTKKNGNLKIALNVDAHKKVFPEVYNKCVHVPVPLNLKVSSSGRFAYHGTAQDVLGHKVKVDITGHFVTTKVAKGHAHYRTGRCSAAGFDYRATFVSGS
jgi:hypothetical protein